MSLTGPRDLRDARRLAELEQVITDGLSSFVAVGEALIEVRDSKLYRQGHATFEAYCRARWDISRVHAHRLMEASDVALALPTGNTPANEAQARELAPVLREHGPEVAAAVMAQASADGPATAATVRAAAEPFRPRLDPIGYHTPADADPLPMNDVHRAKWPHLAASELRVELTQAMYDFGKPGKFEPEDWTERIPRLRPEDIALIRQHLGYIRRWLEKWDQALDRPALALVERSPE